MEFSVEKITFVPLLSETEILWILMATFSPSRWIRGQFLLPICANNTFSWLTQQNVISEPTSTTLSWGKTLVWESGVPRKNKRNYKYFRSVLDSHKRPFPPPKMHWIYSSIIWCWDNGGPNMKYIPHIPKKQGTYRNKTVQFIYWKDA